MESFFEWICLEFLTEARFSAENYFLIAQTMPTLTINETFDGCNENFYNETTRSYTVVETTLIATITTLLSLATIIGNVLVMVSFKMDRRLQTVNNYFLLSLAVADFMIGLFSMPLFTGYTLLEGWKLGPIVCDLWLALDYLCSNASVLNLLMISFDRYFSVTNPLRYRARRNSRLAAIMIACAWILSFLTWPPWILAWPYIEGKRSVPENKCYIQFLETNSYITVITALIAFYVPVIVMCVLYYKIWRETENRKHYLAELIAENEQSTEQATTCLPAPTVCNNINEEEKNCTHRVKDFLITLCNVDCDDGGEDDSTSPGATTPSSAETPIQSSRATSVTLRPEQIAYVQALLNQEEENRAATAKETIYTVMIRLPDPADPNFEPQPTVTMIDEVPATPAPMRSSLSTSALMAHSVNDHRLMRCSSSEVLNASRLTGLPGAKQARLQRPNIKKRNNKVQEKKHDRKAARTLSAILLAFIITWTPYNVLVLVKSVETFVSCNDIIPQVLWDFSYYLCYLNSMINPVCYALANANFRKTYWRILTCTWRKKSKLSIIRGLHSKAS
ncbi:Muscarinic acetylcholine receptor M5, partial [Stegodyphus mimosarum]